MNYGIKCETPEHIKNASTGQLLSIWDMTERMETSRALAIIRGWLMDELEARDPKGFDAWMDSDDMDAGPEKFIKH